MDKPKCKLCKGRHNLSEPHAQPVTRAGPLVTPNVTLLGTKGQSVTEEVTSAEPVTPRVTPGEPCPTCGRRVPMSHAQRQATYRDRTTPRGVSEEQAAGGQTGDVFWLDTASTWPAP